MCEIDIDECSSAPCHNGGSCSQTQVGGYICECPPGTTGASCETDVDECLSMPCENGGDCSQSGVCPPTVTVDRRCGVLSMASCAGSCIPWQKIWFSRYVCDCAAGFGGSDCSVDIDECTSLPCMNAGQCFESRSCATETGVHIDSACAQVGLTTLCGGSCVPLSPPDAYNCVCAGGWTGATCAVDVD